MDLIDAHGLAMAEFDRRVHQIRDDQWDDPTPCTEWSVRDLLRHLVSEQLWAPPLLAGATLAEVGDRFDGDVLGDDPVVAWERSAEAARAAWTVPGVTQRRVHLSYGHRPVTEYGWQMVTDLAVHGWDLARGIGADDQIDPDLARAVLTEIGPHAAQWRATGIFGELVPVPDDADPQTRLLAVLGRRR